ncbi:MAG: spore germination protein [Clostridia bacterium]|nr:spore germination protein [Clostridia bacterium]
MIAETKFRLNNLDIDSLISSGELEQLIEETNSTGIPQVLTTERPDKCAKHLYDGRIVIIVNGNPYALVLPISILDFLCSPEDSNLRPSFANFLRLLRFICYVTTILLPGLYIAVNNFHPELLPTELLFSIIASRENEPFPIIFELMLLEISFEIIREAGIRVPSPIGSLLSIVGGLILGEASVSANIVSPITVIIVAMTGIASFAIPDFSLGFHLRIFRFLFILLGAVTGFLGIGVGIFAYICMLCSVRSFGVPYTVPFTPATLGKNVGFAITNTWNKNNRSSFVAPQRNVRQQNTSKKWEK